MPKIYIIAEAGVNHNGSLDQAIELVDVAAEAGADAVKFQTFQAKKLASAEASKANYQLETTDEAESQLQMLRTLELSRDFHKPIAEHCDQRGIEFLSTPYDVESLRFLVDTFSLPYIKIASADITNAYLLWHAAKTQTSVILSTGMSTLGEAEDALSVLAHGYVADGPPDSLMECRKAYASKEGQTALQDQVHLLHCVTQYPADVDTIHLRAMDTLRDAFGLPVGYSDHTEGISVAIAAAARGATIIEKHYTLDRSLPGPDHNASLEPVELRSMVTAIRAIEDALGSMGKYPNVAEWNNQKAMRRSLVADQPISAGDIFTQDNITARRPGNGISPIHYWDKCGTEAQRDYQPGDILS